MSTYDLDHDVYAIAQSSNREVLEDMIRSLPFLDVMEEIFRTTVDTYAFMYWNSEPERARAASWARYYYPPPAPYAIEISEGSHAMVTRYLLKS